MINRRHRGDFQWTSNPIAPAAYIQNRIDSCGADCKIDQGFAPGSTKGIADDDAECSMAAGDERRQESLCRGIRVLGQQDRDLFIRGIGKVNAGVGTNETVPCFADHHAMPSTYDSNGLSKHDFDVAWILFVFASNLDGTWARLHVGERHQTPLGL